MASAIVNKIGLVKTICIASLFFSFFVFSQVIPAMRARDGNNHQYEGFKKFIYEDAVIMAILYIGTFMTGFGVALSAVVQGEYISSCASERTKGFYFGYFLAIMQFSMVIGNSTGSFLILKATGPEFFLMMGIIILVGMVGFGFMKLPDS